MLKMSENYFIGYAEAHDKDVAALSVMKRVGPNNFEIVNIFTGDEATWMYEKLVGIESKSTEEKDYICSDCLLAMVLENYNNKYKKGI